ncbi:Thioredoxin Asp f 29 like protein [Verticillium longisporum]|uniref:Thioredoxin Asp f 29 like protein n=1 Tax=Verticillium longisporum TaxID=100787 RepID=A0A8I2Z8G1_VERLO|nr:Thioredoxin Asp f 29 like protein [Verticillium longisporum]
MGVHNINSKADFYKAINGEEVTLAADNVLPSKNVAILDCFATWCGPCKTIAPIYVQLSEKKLGIRAMPTFMVFKDGEKVEEIVGANPPALEKALLKYSA